MENLCERRIRVLSMCDRWISNYLRIGDYARAERQAEVQLGIIKAWHGQETGKRWKMRKARIKKS